MKKSRNFKQNWLKTFLESSFQGYNLHYGLTGFVNAFSYVCFPLSINLFFNLSKIIICTPILCNKKYRFPCSFKSLKVSFLFTWSPLLFAWLREFYAQYKMRKAKLRNSLNFNEWKKNLRSLKCVLRNIFSKAGIFRGLWSDASGENLVRKDHHVTIKNLLSDCEEKRDIEMKNNVIWLVQAKKDPDCSV